MPDNNSKFFKIEIMFGFDPGAPRNILLMTHVIFFFEYLKDIFFFLIPLFGKSKNTFETRVIELTKGAIMPI